MLIAIIALKTVLLYRLSVKYFLQIQTVKIKCANVSCNGHLFLFAAIYR